LLGRSDGSGPGDEPATAWQAPHPGDAYGGSLDDGTPILLVRHRDGTSTAVVAVSPHRPYGLVRLVTEDVPGRHLRIRFGAPIPGLPRDSRGVAAKGGSCAGPTLQAAGLVFPGIAASGLTPAELLRMATRGRWSLQAVLLAGPGGPVRLCSATGNAGTCHDEAQLRGYVPQVPTGGDRLELRGTWFVLIEGGALADPIRAG